MNSGKKLVGILLLAFAVSPHTYSQINYQRLTSFGSAELSGILPASALIEGRDGGLYGTTLERMVQGVENEHSGTVFRLNKDGSHATVLHTFGDPDAAAGTFPASGRSSRARPRP